MAFPSKRTLEIESAILSRLSEGDPLAVICRGDDMPHPTTWRDWCDQDEALAIAYARAREVGFDAIAADCLSIADDTAHDTKMVGAEGEEREAANTEWISRSKLRVETRLKLLAKWDPKRYGEATTLKHADADGEKLPVDETTRVTRLAAIVLALREQADDAAD